MSVNGMRDNFELDDFLSLSRTAGIRPMKAKALIDQVAASVKRWQEFAGDANVSEERISKIAKSHRLKLANL